MFRDFAHIPYIFSSATDFGPLSDAELYTVFKEVGEVLRAHGVDRNYPFFYPGGDEDAASIAALQHGIAHINTLQDCWGVALFLIAAFVDFTECRYCSFEGLVRSINDRLAQDTAAHGGVKSSGDHVLLVFFCNCFSSVTKTKNLVNNEHFRGLLSKKSFIKEGVGIRSKLSAGVLVLSAKAAMMVWFVKKVRVDNIDDTNRLFQKDVISLCYSGIAMFQKDYEDNTRYLCAGFGLDWLAFVVASFYSNRNLPASYEPCTGYEVLRTGEFTIRTVDWSFYRDEHAPLVDLFNRCSTLSRSVLEMASVVRHISKYVPFPPNANTDRVFVQQTIQGVNERFSSGGDFRIEDFADTLRSIESGSSRGTRRAKRGSGNTASTTSTDVQPSSRAANASHNTSSSRARQVVKRERGRGSEPGVWKPKNYYNVRDRTGKFKKNGDRVDPDDEEEDDDGYDDYDDDEDEDGPDDDGDERRSGAGAMRGRSDSRGNVPRSRYNAPAASSSRNIVSHNAPIPAASPQKRNAPSSGTDRNNRKEKKQDKKRKRHSDDGRKPVSKTKKAKQSRSSVPVSKYATPAPPPGQAPTTAKASVPIQARSPPPAASRHFDVPALPPAPAHNTGFIGVTPLPAPAPAANSGLNAPTAGQLVAHNVQPGISVLDRATAGSSLAMSAPAGGGHAGLQYSPGYISPGGSAANASGPSQLVPYAAAPVVDHVLPPAGGPPPVQNETHPAALGGVPAPSVVPPPGQNVPVATPTHLVPAAAPLPPSEPAPVQGTVAQGPHAQLPPSGPAPAQNTPVFEFTRVGMQVMSRLTGTDFGHGLKSPPGGKVAKPPSGGRSLKPPPNGDNRKPPPGDNRKPPPGDNRKQPPGDNRAPPPGGHSSKPPPGVTRPGVLKKKDSPPKQGFNPSHVFTRAEGCSEVVDGQAKHRIDSDHSGSTEQAGVSGTIERDAQHDGEQTPRRKNLKPIESEDEEEEEDEPEEGDAEGEEGGEVDDESGDDNGNGTDHEQEVIEVEDDFTTSDNDDVDDEEEPEEEDTDLSFIDRDGGSRNSKASWHPHDDESESEEDLQIDE